MYNLSVIIPVYNKEKYITKTLESVLAQTYKSIEIVIVNDGSKDNTASIINDYSEKYSSIKVIHQENSGVTTARINGIKAASGEWIGFVDADDYVEPEMFETLMKNAEKHNVDISHCGCQMVSEDGKDRTYFYNTGKIVVQNNEEALRDLVSGSVYEPSLCNKIFRKSLFSNLINNNLMDKSIKINEDLLMNYWLFKESNGSVFEDVCLYQYISTANSASKTKFTTDPLKVLKIIYEDINDGLKDLILSRIIYQLINYCTMSLKKDKEIRKPHRTSARKELRSRLGTALKSSIGTKVKIMALWVAIWPWSYGAFHKLYAKATGRYNEYSLN
jgi:glycosyltransferase involved in cell wall biosynthesis